MRMDKLLRQLNLIRREFRDEGRMNKLKNNQNQTLPFVQIGRSVGWWGGIFQLPVFFVWNNDGLCTFFHSCYEFFFDHSWSPFCFCRLMSNNFQIGQQMNCEHIFVNIFQLVLCVNSAISDILHWPFELWDKNETGVCRVIRCTRYDLHLMGLHSWKPLQRRSCFASPPINNVNNFVSQTCQSSQKWLTSKDKMIGFVFNLFLSVQHIEC